jgi:hypothetical protein
LQREISHFMESCGPVGEPFKGCLGSHCCLFVARRSLLTCLLAPQAHCSLGCDQASGPTLERHSGQQQHDSFEIERQSGEEALYGIA